MLRLVLVVASVVGLAHLSGCCCCPVGPDVPTVEASPRDEIPALQPKRLAFTPTNHAR